MNEEQRKQREQALRAAALNCFATERWEDVSVSKIAKLAGVAKGTVYLHFASKDEICARLAQEFHDQLQQKYLDISGTGYEQLKELINTSFNHFHEQAKYRHVLQYSQREHFLFNLDPSRAEVLQKAQHNHCKRIAVALNQGVHDKTLLPDAEQKLIGICSTLSGALDRFNRKHAYREEILHANKDRKSPGCINHERTNIHQQSQKAFIACITGFILSSVENKTITKVTTEKTLAPLESTLEVQ